MYLPVKDMTGNQTGQIEVSDEVFGAPVNKPLMHQALVRQLSNARLGTHKTKTRGEVRGGGRKPWKQKGTGRARQGSIRASQWVGGGTAFGPLPRTYVKAMPKKMHRAALRCALSVKAGAGQIVVLDGLSIAEPKTKLAAKLFDALGVNKQNVLFVIADRNENVDRSVRNLPSVKLIQSGYLNVRDLLGHDVLVMVKDAVELVEIWLGTDAAPAADVTPVASVAPVASAPPVVDVAPVAASASSADATSVDDDASDDGEDDNIDDTAAAEDTTEETEE